MRVADMNGEREKYLGSSIHAILEFRIAKGFLKGSLGTGIKHLRR
jgi:hypothetical protein